MLDALASRGHKMVLILDPHIKADDACARGEGGAAWTTPSCRCPREDSLRFFLRTRCKFTGKRVDIIKATDLTSEYNRFCLRHKGLAKVPPTRRAIVAAGASFDRLTLSFVVPRAGTRINLASHKL
ncbi:hypothetical protein KFE25_012397 [Diacronema lutheri]|uniref:Uncharacterized protein n=1 Tax=Diacronema lutheri TaxID=2081491 RepID=A0A8J5XR13_DIALT|nr:hypothetical protein KFE25_012397 [Diacronema lutheri]